MSKWKMVPVEPTDQMIRAIDGLICSSYLWPVYAYRAMIDAAPVQQTDPLGYFTFNKEWNVWEQMSAKYKNASDATPLYLHPPSAELARLRAENERLREQVAAKDLLLDGWMAASLPGGGGWIDALSAENERLKADARPYTVTCEPVIDRDWPEAHSVRIRNGGQRFDIGMHLETLEEAEHYATMLRVALGIDAAMTQGQL